jgi:PKD repeat protein
MSGAGSSDPDDDALTYAWSFGDGSGGTSPAVTHAYATPGTFTVRLIVTDIRTLADTTFTTAVIETPEQAVADARAVVGQLQSSGALSLADARWVDNKLDVAGKLLGHGDVTAAVNQLQQVIRRLADSGPVTGALVDALHQLIQSLTS